MAKLKRIGVYGGAFDPPHAAHRALAVAGLEQLQLDGLHVIPTGDAWHKASRLSPAADRLAMCQLVFAKLKRTCMDERELRRAGPSYTSDTLRELREYHGACRLFLLIGADEARDFHRWHDTAGIAAMASLAIASRPEIQDWSHDDPLPGLTGRRPELCFLDMAPLAVSSSDLRARLAGGAEAAQALVADGLLMPEVARYIMNHRLYQEPTHA